MREACFSGRVDASAREESALAPHLRGGEHEERQSGERIVLTLDVQVCDQDEPADDGLVPDAGFARTRAGNAITTITPPATSATSATSATQTPCASPSDDAPSAPPRHAVRPCVMQTNEEPISMASPIKPPTSMWPLDVLRSLRESIDK